MPLMFRETKTRDPRELSPDEIRDTINDAIDFMDDDDRKKLYDHLLLEGWIDPEA